MPLLFAFIKLLSQPIVSAFVPLLLEGGGEGERWEFNFQLVLNHHNLFQSRQLRTNLPILSRSGLVSSRIVYIADVRRFGKPSTTTELLECPFCCIGRKFMLCQINLQWSLSQGTQIPKAAGLGRAKQKSFQYRLKQFITGSTAEFHIL